MLASGVSGCASYTDRTYAYRSDAGFRPGTTYYAYSTPARTYHSYDRGYYANGVYHPPATAWNYGTPGDNYYSSRSDYYRSYQGIHGGPERTDGP